MVLVSPGNIVIATTLAKKLDMQNSKMIRKMLILEAYAKFLLRDNLA